MDRLEQEGDIAADYLEELLDIADLDGDLDMDVDGDRAAVSIVGAELTQLVGSKGEVLDALQELTRLAVFRETGERSRLMLDISGYRAQKREELIALAAETVAEVKASGERVVLNADVPLRAQGRARRRRRRGSELGVRGRRAPPVRGGPPSRVMDDNAVSRETPSAPEVAGRVFPHCAASVGRAVCRAPGHRWRRPRPDRPARGPTAVGAPPLNCALLAELIPDDASVCDIGSGAGLPGLVLAVASPDLQMTLVEPLLRRTTFLIEVVDQLALGNVEVVRGRADVLHGDRRFDVVTSRAVAPLDRLLGWSMPLVRPEGALVAMKGSSVVDEIEAAQEVLGSLGCAAPTVHELGEGVVDSTTMAVRVAWADPARVSWPLVTSSPSGSASGATGSGSDEGEAEA